MNQVAFECLAPCEARANPPDVETPRRPSRARSSLGRSDQRPYRAPRRYSTNPQHATRRRIAQESAKPLRASSEAVDVRCSTQDCGRSCSGCHRPSGRPSETPRRQASRRPEWGESTPRLLREQRRARARRTRDTRTGTKKSIRVFLNSFSFPRRQAACDRDQGRRLMQPRRPKPRRDQTRCQVQ